MPRSNGLGGLLDARPEGSEGRDEPIPDSVSRLLKPGASVGPGYDRKLPPPAEVIRLHGPQATESDGRRPAGGAAAAQHSRRSGIAHSPGNRP